MGKFYPKRWKKLSWKQLYHKLGNHHRKGIKMNTVLDNKLALILRESGMTENELKEYIMNFFSTPEHRKMMVAKLKKLKHSIKNLDREWQRCVSVNKYALLTELHLRQQEYISLKRTYNLLVPQKKIISN